MALEWSDVDLGKRQLRVERSEWKGHLTSTKGGRVRYVPMTTRLAEALQKHRHLRGRRVILDQGGESMTQKMVQARIGRAARSAHVRPGVHILRHTFCSHLAMRGCAGSLDSGACGPPRPDDYAAVHAPESVRCGSRDPGSSTSRGSKERATVWQRATARLLTPLARAR